MIGKEADLAAFGAEEEFIFNGVDGLGHQDFLQQIRRKAFKEGKTRDDAWMADLAVLHMSGEALAWFETLPDDVQKNWSNLKRAIIQKYGDGSASDQIQPLQAANIATTRGYGNVENNATPPVDPLLPARIRIANWDTPALASTIYFPSSERDWINEGRQRKWKFGGNRSMVYWHLVEPSDPVPDNAISVGTESGVTFYSLRAWHEGGLTLGKITTQGLFWRAKRAWIIWHGREIPWSGSFEVLVGDQSAVRWIRPQVTGSFEAVEGGFEAGNSKALLVARFELGNVVQPGKVFSGDFHGYYGWWNKESVQGNFQVLAWA
ncbi:hypothetical protein M407DRAFT_211767 [Tulasnella calospora MUT 4182]|uniref:Uncharacterized protein n=1 Tax=Tulasnella calospora MUT 4182 TaxID=1051891 RepID=A0A0C3PMC0_9AGAM|nr:hypothetical protein M407DRAFT_211767 [Tulasnella calospora MUT 4182]